MPVFDTPVLFLVFNRPAHTAKVLARIREVKPKFLYVAADGPRVTHREDVEKCEKVRALIAKGIDWDCEVKTNFRNQNLGCGRGPADAISWFFEHVEEGIILEDDCLPAPTFFLFCSTLLKRYRNELQVMHISGNNYQNGLQRGESSYYFSIYSHSWGWATWRRCWEKYDYFLTDFAPGRIEKGLAPLDSKEKKFWLENFDLIVTKKPDDIWDYQWMYAILKNNGLCAIPNVNLIKNIGFDVEATHTKEASPELTEITLGKIDLITHPKELKIDRQADQYTFNNFFCKKDKVWRRVKNQLLLIPFVRTLYDKLYKNLIGLVANAKHHD